MVFRAGARAGTTSNGRGGSRVDMPNVGPICPSKRRQKCRTSLLISTVHVMYVCVYKVYVYFVVRRIDNPYLLLSVKLGEHVRSSPVDPCFAYGGGREESKHQDKRQELELELERIAPKTITGSVMRRVSKKRQDKVVDEINLNSNQDRGIRRIANIMPAFSYPSTSSRTMNSNSIRTQMTAEIDRITCSSFTLLASSRPQTVGTYQHLPLLDQRPRPTTSGQRPATNDKTQASVWSPTTGKSKTSITVFATVKSSVQHLIPQLLLLLLPCLYGVINLLSLLVPLKK